MRQYRHTILAEPLTIPQSGELVITGDEASHASRSKRLKAGEAVRLLDGAGTIALAHVTQAKKSLLLDIIEVNHVEPSSPQVHIYSAAPKGPRLEKMIDQLAQTGAASWQLLHTNRGVVEPGDTKTERIQRVSRAAIKQCGRPYEMAINEPVRLADLLEDETVDPDTYRLILADEQGAPATELASGGALFDGDSPLEEIRVLVGPEGGFTPEEREQIIQAGAHPLWLSPHVLRTETASVLACAAVLGATAQ